MRIQLFSLISLIPICIIFLSCCIFGVSKQCLDDQQSLLLQLKNNLIFDHAKSTKLAWWNGSVDCCSWEGVTCQDGRVIGLDLTDEAISGGLNSSGLFNLQYLKNLSLAYNNFSSSMIPSEFEKLTNLVHLNLSTAGFSGQVPMAISYLTKLVILDLSTFPINALSLENPNLHMLVQNLSKLIELHLDGVTISAQGNEWCQALSSSLPKLKVLSLSSCNLFGPFHPSILMLKSLTTIRLNSNDFLSPIPEFFANFTNLTYLDLGDSGLNGMFPQKIFQIPTLEKLDLSENSLLQGALPDFPHDGSLQILRLSDTSFSGTIPHTIGNLRMLSKIDFSLCNFNGSIPYSMASLTHLVSLDMSDNFLTGPIPSFTMAKNLTQINLHDNELTGHITSTQWQELLHLVFLELSSNLLNGSIPISLFSLPSLKELWLDDNQFSGQLNESHKISSLPLQAIYLNNNNLEGKIPMFIFKLQGLESLSLSFNNFSGSLQLKVIQQLRNLSYLQLSHNNLLIEYDEISVSSSSFPQLFVLGLASCKLKRFPNFLRNHSKLEILDLSNNQIGGSIPSWIGKFHDLAYLNLSFNYLMTLEEPFSNLSCLQYLDLHSNQLQGELLVLVPEPVGIFIKVLDFSMNNLHSTIPNTIGNLISTTFFSISSNKLYGHIPESICNVSYLEALDLSNNFFSGPIPQCLIKMSETLAVLNLRRNNISGPIPNYFPRNCVLQTLNLNGNQIEGNFPKSLVNCTNLEVLDMGYNQFEDIFPCYLRKASKLRVLILRSNRLYGNIFCPKPNVTWPMLQIVDGAVNKFTGRFFTVSGWTALMGVKIVTKPKLSYLKFQSDHTGFSYQDSITVVIKGLDLELVRILTIFTLIDFSCNQLDGPIPEAIGDLTSLYLLNLSHNAFHGQIPSSLGRLSNLESLDLSCNKLAAMGEFLCSPTPCLPRSGFCFVSLQTPKVRLPARATAYRMEVGGSDSDGREFKNAEEMWSEQAGDPSRKTEWYRQGVGYWQGVEASVDGVLGGYGHVNESDVRGSEAFLNTLLSERFPNAGTDTHLVALDCGSGIGRVTKNLLIRYFNEVDLLEPVSHFLEEARANLVPENQMSSDTHKATNFFCVPLQEFTPAAGRYDVIWVQWCIGHLTDDDFVTFFRRAKAGLKPGGFFVLKENIAKSGFVLDNEDRSITRSDLYFKELFSQCGLHIYKSKDQKGLPEELFAVKMYALTTDSPKKVYRTRSKAQANQPRIIK